MQYYPIKKSPIIDINNSAPPVFYKYTPVEFWLPSMLDGSSLKFTARNDFNDPFDSRSSAHINYNSNNIEEYLRNGIGELNSHTQIEINSLIENIMESKFQFYENSPIEKDLDNTGILSLASSWNNILLWSHYAMQHQGICVGFNSKKDVFMSAQEVSYSDDFPIIIRPDDSSVTMLEKTFLRKSLCWKYEEEWRVLKPKWTNEEKEDFFERNRSGRANRFMRSFDGPKIYKFDKKSIIEITLGMSISEEDERKVIAAIKAANVDIEVFKASREKGKYEVKREKISI